MTQVFFVAGRLAGMNDFEGAMRWKYRRAKEQAHELIALSIKQAKITPIGSVYVHFLWHEKNKRRDPDNFSSMGRKWVLDALVNCGILMNDGWGQILGWNDAWIVDQERPGVLVTLEERI